MKKMHKAVFLGMASLILLAGCGGGGGERTWPLNDNEYFEGYGYRAKSTYNALLGYNLKYLNSAVTMSSEDCDHIANFVDGLVENDEYGRLSKALAEKVEANTIRDQYKFTIKDNIKWMTHKGEQYVANVEGTRVPQFVTAEDFVTTAKFALDFRNASDSYYLPAMFLKGGYEYWAYTYALYIRDNNQAAEWNFTPAFLNTDVGLAVLTSSIGQMVNVSLNVRAEDIPAISNFSRVGVKASTENGKSVVTYDLENPSHFFLSVLTYTPFLPINSAFISEIGFTNFGEDNTKFLYCGAFLLKKWDELSLQYVKNKEYWDKDKVNLDVINYSVLRGEIPNDYIRKEFEEGHVDAFGISQNDTEGWNKYILGANGTGTMEKPASDLAYSREIEVVDSTFMFELNVNRNAGRPDSIKTASSNLTSPAMLNTDKALKINEVRELILNGIDYSVYNKRYGQTQDIQAQYQMWTYVPKGFVQNDDNGRDYIEYVYDAYAAKFGVTSEEAAAKLKQGQIDTRNTKAEIAALANKAKDAIALVNAAGGVEVVKADGSYGNKEQITFPIQVEHLGLNWDPEQASYDEAWVEEFNQDVNACTLNDLKVTAQMPKCTGSRYPFFEIVNNKKVTDQTYVNMGELGQYHLYVSGWGADYADPLSYMDAFVTGGDMSTYTGTQKPVVDYKIVDGAVVKGTILEQYDALVTAGRDIYDNNESRFNYFAKAEVELIFGAHIMKPLYMNGQFTSLEVTKVIEYERPNATYGLSSYKLKGVFVLTTPLKAVDRLESDEKYQINKATEVLDSNYTIVDRIY